MTAKSDVLHSVRPIGELDIIRQSREGLLRAEADRVAGLIGMTDKEMAASLGLSTSYLHRLNNRPTYQSGRIRTAVTTREPASACTRHIR